jgi:acetyl esterase/lipase
VLTHRPSARASIVIVSLSVFAACGSDDDITSTNESPAPATVDTASTTIASPDTAPPTTAEPTTTAPATTVPATSTTVTPVAPPVPIVDDVAYASLSPAQRLDLYVPAGRPGPIPLVVFIHGGAWMTGDKRAEYAVGVVALLLDQGYAVASVNYRLSDEAIFPAQLLDVKAAIRWLRTNGPGKRIDPDRIAVAGESAGAHLAALLGTSAGEFELDDPALGSPGVSSAVQAVVDWYGPVDLVTADAQLAENPNCAGSLREPGEPDPASSQLLGAPPDQVPALAATANPITYLTPGREVPPFLIEHGDFDCVVPYQGSVALHEAIEDFAGPGRSQLVIVPGSGHYTAFDAAGQIPTVLEFLASTIGPPST